MTDDPIKKAWQDSVATAENPTLEDVRAEAAKLRRQTFLGVLLEAGGYAIIVPIFTVMAITKPNLVERMGATWIVVGTLCLAWRLIRRLSSYGSEQAGMAPVYRSMRQQLVRQRDALRSSIWWYLLAIPPGLLLMVSVPIVSKAMAEGGNPNVPALLFSAFLIGIYIFVWWANQHRAEELQFRIDEIDALIRGNE